MSVSKRERRRCIVYFFLRIVHLSVSYPFYSAAASDGYKRLLPRRFRELEAMTPPVKSQWTEDLVAPVTPARGIRRFRVALLAGCAQDLIFSDVTRVTAGGLPNQVSQVGTTLC